MCILIIVECQWTLKVARHMSWNPTCISMRKCRRLLFGMSISLLAERMGNYFNGMNENV